MVPRGDRDAKPWAASTDTVTATRPLSLIAPASDPPLAWEGATKLSAVMNCFVPIVDAATRPLSAAVSVTASGGTVPRSTRAVVISPFWIAFSPLVPFGMFPDATNASTIDTLRAARLSADDT